MLYNFVTFSVISKNLVLQAVSFSDAPVVFSGWSDSAVERDKCSR